MTHHYLYILAGHKNGPTFVGTTRNLARRLAQHRIGRASIDAFRIDKLVYAERFNSIEAATGRAHALRHASREWVGALIARKNPQWRDLATASTPQKAVPTPKVA